MITGKPICITLFLLLWINLLHGQNHSLRVFSEHEDPGRQLEYLLKRQFEMHLDKRLDAYDSIKTRSDCENWQKERRSFFIRQIGGLPNRTPLHPRVVKTLKGDGYHVENIMFESRPNHHVTANLYLPETGGPWPAVLVPCGHSHTGKAAGGYQRMCILLARNGMAALCYDPIGQGERYQSLDFEREHERFASVSYRLETPHPRVRFLCTTEHTMMGVGAILLGTNTAQYRIWDGIRAIDYLQSRKDILPDKIACTGNSGGGTMTAYLMALDDRIVAAAPTCYLTTFRKLIETKGAQDAEQNIHGQIAFGMDEPDYVMMRAPKPTLICASTRDATFDITGTWDLYRQAKRFYARLGFPERVELNEADVPHGMYLQHREAIARWMHRWLLGGDKEIWEIDPESLPGSMTDQELRQLSDGDWTKEELYCSPEGQVLLMENERSVFEINAEIERNLRSVREKKWKSMKLAEKQRIIRQTIGCTPSIPADSQCETIETIQQDGFSIQKLKLSGGKGQLTLPGLLYLPETATKPSVLLLDGDSMSNPSALCEQYAREGRAVLSAELTGIGETETGHHKRDYGRGRFGRDVQEIFLAYLMGQSFVGMRTDDVFRWSNCLSQYVDQKIELLAIGETCIPALHAATLDPDRFSTIRLKNMISSWGDIVAAPVNQNQLVNTVHGVLNHYDLPDLIALHDQKKIQIEEPWDPLGQPIQ